ncbi:hypothetical protein LJC45_06215 [Alistipes sp. OttesenSCG-928-B03]|nr:hypothetical protein [Alistipes sp. OttesenSCG-928-B03]
MKATIDKSRLMKRAWQLYKGVNGFFTFSGALRQAWREEKERVISLNKRLELEAIRARNAEGNRIAQEEFNRMNALMSVAIAHQYANARPGQYFGD